MSNDLLHEIERLNKVVEDLQAENERLRGVLKEIAKAFDTGQTWSEVVFAIRDIVRAELNIKVKG
jgi:hypothetical protein